MFAYANQILSDEASRNRTKAAPRARNNGKRESGRESRLGESVCARRLPNEGRHTWGILLMKVQKNGKVTMRGPYTDMTIKDLETMRDDLLFGKQITAIIQEVEAREAEMFSYANQLISDIAQREGSTFHHERELIASQDSKNNMNQESLREPRENLYNRMDIRYMTSRPTQRCGKLIWFAKTFRPQRLVRITMKSVRIIKRFPRLRAEAAFS